MRELKILAALIAVFAVGVVATGCGDDDESSDTTTPAATSEETTETTADDTTTEETTTSEDETTTEDSGGEASAEDIYNACIDLIEGTPAEDVGQASCEQARTAFENCAEQAEAVGNDNAQELAVRACQQAADQTLATLEASGAG
jgi:hypothetical protein